MKNWKKLRAKDQEKKKLKKTLKKNHKKKTDQKGYNSLGKIMQIQRVNTKVIIIYITFIINSCNTYSEKEYYTNSANVRNSVLKQLVKRFA